ncbi:MAG TPA: hypothetical protein VN277_04870, partial [Acidiferrobacterales bacterium]|nr:hypothetical protein [Acidiferrobacterales bacterium]
QPQDGDLQAALRVKLRKALEAEPRLAQELGALLGELAPDAARVTQLQSVTGDGATGVQVAGNGNAVDVS